MSHPTLRDRPTTLIIGAIETMPIIGSLKRFHAMDESTVCTVETQDNSGAVAIGISRHDLPEGFAVYSSIEEAEAMIALIQIAIDDAKRIEAGEAPLAQEGNPRRDN